MSKRHRDSPVPDDEALACTLWKCHYGAVYGPGDGSITWWTLQPIERTWWKETAFRFEHSTLLAEIRAEAKAGVLDAIKAVREQAAEERAARHENGEPLTEYGSGVLDGLDRAWLACADDIARGDRA